MIGFLEIGRISEKVSIEVLLLELVDVLCCYPTKYGQRSVKIQVVDDTVLLPQYTEV